MNAINGHDRQQGTKLAFVGNSFVSAIHTLNQKGVCFWYKNRILNGHKNP